MSGAGKSAIVGALAAQGRRAVDLDTPTYSEWTGVPDGDPAAGSAVAPGRDWVWSEDRVGGLLAAPDAGELFASGCAANMGRFLQCFAVVVLLSAPVDVLLARLAARPPGEYGSAPAERERVVALVESVEPRLRQMADHELDTSGRVEDTVAALLALVDSRA
jgi:shikimate kinase